MRGWGQLGNNDLTELAGRVFEAASGGWQEQQRRVSRRNDYRRDSLLPCFNSLFLPLAGQHSNAAYHRRAGTRQQL